MKIIKEACIDNLENAKYFIEKKIDRFETCSRLDMGGLTPKKELFEYIRNNSKIEQVIMIRTNDNFSVDENELSIMKNQIKEFKKLGANSFIFGFVKNNEINLEAIDSLIDVCGESEYLFHMAIDELENYDKNLEILVERGFKRVLLKGGKTPAINNLDNLKRIVEKYSNRIEILIGGSVTKNNYEEISNKTGAKQFHGTKIA